MFDAAIFDSVIFDTEGAAPAVGKGGRKLSFDEAQALYDRQTRRKSLPDVDARPEPAQKRRTEAQGATEGPTGAVARVEFADAFTAPARLPSLADVRAQIAAAQQDAMRAAAVSEAVQVRRMVAAEFAEEEAVAMLILMMEGH